MIYKCFFILASVVIFAGFLESPLSACRDDDDCSYSASDGGCIDAVRGGKSCVETRIPPNDTHTCVCQ